VARARGGACGALPVKWLRKACFIGALSKTAIGNAELQVEGITGTGLWYRHPDKGGARMLRTLGSQATLGQAR
jgi:hypothetical protein